MKKLITLSILMVGMMSVGMGQSALDWTKFEVSESINDIQDCQEWTKQDMENGLITKEIGLLYLNKYEETIDRLILVYNDLKEIERTTK